MCFSAEVSYAAAAVLFPLGTISIYKAYQADWRYVAICTLLFGLQQLFEGLAWTGGEAGDMAAVRHYSLAYMFFSWLAWTGHIWEAVFLWWLPLKIGAVYINLYLSWAPHQPMTGRGRDRETRAFRSIWGNIGSSGMQYHIVHHLYPNIPLNRNPAALRALRPILEERGCDLGGM